MIIFPYPILRGDTKIACEFAKNCHFLTSKKIYGGYLGKKLVQQFCMSDFQHCARFMIAREFGEEAIPFGLMPDNVEKAKAMLEEKLQVVG